MKETQNTETLQEPVVLTEDELAALDEGIRSAATERHYTLEEAIEFARERRKLWKKIPKAVSV